MEFYKGFWDSIKGDMLALHN